MVEDREVSTQEKETAETTNPTKSTSKAKASSVRRVRNQAGAAYMKKQG